MKTATIMSLPLVTAVAIGAYGVGQGMLGHGVGSGSSLQDGGAGGQGHIASVLAQTGGAGPSNQVQSVPIPGTLPLLGGGLVGLAALFWRHRATRFDERNVSQER